MTQPFSILAVCTANICRSPMVELLLREELMADPRQGFELSSVGILGHDGSEMDPRAAQELRRLGGDPKGFRARSFTPQIGAGADLILTAAVEHRARVLREVPQALRRTFTVLEFAHLVSAIVSHREPAESPADVVRQAVAARGAARLQVYDVLDPHGGTRELHARTAATIHGAVIEIAAALTDRRRN